jgi:3-deoxy-D-manno-octulosonate 8-phosphate phosphatase (KDO 8-P phosphatase)
MLAGGPRARLGEREARLRAARLKLVLTDCDGVLTDTGVYYSESGEALRRFSVRDGMGVERLRLGGILTGIVTGERSPFVERRAEKLDVPYLFQGVSNKARHFATIRSETGLGPEACAYIGDDVNDLGIIALVGSAGLTAAPADALPAVVNEVHYRCPSPGGHGAFRDFAEWILELRGEEP